MASTTEPPDTSFDVPACETAFNGSSCSAADRAQLTSDMACGSDHGDVAGEIQLAICVCPGATFADAGTGCLATVPGVSSACLTALKAANASDL